MADRILIVDDEEIIRSSARFILQQEGMTVDEAANGKIAWSLVRERSYDLVITDLEMPEMKGTELLGKIREISPEIRVIIITAYGSLETAIDALRKGASDYILKPIEFGELVVKIRPLLDHKKLVLENKYLRKEIDKGVDFTRLIGKSAAMLKVCDTIDRIAPTDGTVLITGKSGTGKEVIARAIHARSRRSGKPFIAVNCGAIPETLVESELFGHKKGSFTGAVADKEGYFKAADGGTLLLDEISEMPVQLQVRLLRAIEQKEITPVGSNAPIGVDVRFIATTNLELGKEIEEGRFREDLYYRLNVVEIRLPSLEERREDIPLLVAHFVTKFSGEMRKKISGVDPAVMSLLTAHKWRGEVRELENIIERAVIFSRGESITIDALPDSFAGTAPAGMPAGGTSLEDAIGLMTKNFIAEVLKRHGYDKEKSADELGISLPTLYRRIKELGIPGDPAKDA